MEKDNAKRNFVIRDMSGRWFGIDLEKASGAEHHALPIPAVYIVDKTGKIVFAHSNPDYRERLDTKTIIGELEKLK